MRILVVSQYFWPEQFVINSLSAGLTSRGHEVTVLTGVPNYPGGKLFFDFSVDPKAYAAYKGVRIFRVPLVLRRKGKLNLLLNYFSFMVSACVFGIWKLRGQRFDIVLTCQLSPATVGIPGALFAYLKRVPMVLWVLDLWPETLSAVGAVKSRVLLSSVRALVNFIYHRSDLILAQSRSFVPEIKSCASSRTSVIYFPSWAEDVFYLDVPPQAHGIPAIKDAFQIMFAGNIGEAQDFECILSAAYLLREQPKIRWLIVGDGSMLAWVRSEIERRGIGKSVCLLGFYPTEQMPGLFRYADAMLLTLANRPAFSMTIPGKLRSYLAAGKPIVAAINGEGADILKEANAGFVCASGDAYNLAAIVLKMSSLPLEERQAMGYNGLQYSKREFDRDMMIDRAESYFSGLVN